MGEEFNQDLQKLEYEHVIDWDTSAPKVTKVLTLTTSFAYKWARTGNLIQSKCAI